MFQKRRIWGVVLVAVLVVSSLAGFGCGNEPVADDGGDPGGGDTKEPITIGIPLPLTGSKAAFGEIKKNSYLMALEEINAAGGINGHELRFDIQDTQGKAEVAQAIVEDFISNKGYPMIAGGYSSTVTYAIAMTAQKYRIPYLSDTGAADKITQQGWEYEFRLNPPSSMYNTGLNGFLLEVVEPTSAAILYEHSDFGTSTAAAFEEWAGENGVEIVLKEGYESGALDFKPILSVIKEEDPDVVYMVSYVMDAAQLMKQAKELQLSPKLFAGAAAGFALPEFVENAAGASEYVVTGTLWSPQVSYPGAQEYFDQYYEKYGSYTEYHGAEAYSTAYVIKDVLERAEAFEPEAIREALEETDLMTVFGPVRFQDFDGYTNQNSTPTLVMQVINGKHETIWPLEAASTEYIYPVPDWDERK